MILKQLIDLYDLLDSPGASGRAAVDYLRGIDPDCDAETYVLEGPKGSTDMVRVRIPGERGRSTGGDAPTIALLGRLGGLGARPERIGFVSDGDGALTVLACAAKLLSMHARGDVLAGDVVLSTHVCPHAPTSPHEPVPFMGSPVATADVNREEVGGADVLDAVLVVDTTKGNRIMNERGFMISPTVKQGCILRVSDDLVGLVEIATGRRARTFPLSMADITPYGNGLYHLNSILQPCTATDAPVVGVAITTETAVPGCATGATHLGDLDEAGSFMIEAAKAFGEGKCSFFDADEYARFVERYGTMAHLQTMGELPAEDPQA
ncbi:DUF1177 domain-containing protein [Arabiibacter massiliensis]|uniref:DUF1177 domain-containing protein n=1 Tax=Arabiibacter massiliensis TaxID=1870985 RepID=UPI0009BC23FF|nr:DUF1177 domain-containing protein [Arabiibacter massiliensis]